MIRHKGDINSTSLKEWTERIGGNNVPIITLILTHKSVLLLLEI